MFGRKEIEHPLEAIRLFNLCEATNWSVLPVAGGWYDQHPKFVDSVTYLLHQKAERDRHEQEVREAKMNQNKRK